MTNQLHFAGNGKAYNEERETDSFEYGTVSGSWHFYEGWPGHAHTPLLCIIDVRNSEEGNGQFRQFLERLFTYCTERHCDVLAVDVAGFLVPRLTEKHGFEKLPDSTHLVRRCYSANIMYTH